MEYVNHTNTFCLCGLIHNETSGVSLNCIRVLLRILYHLDKISLLSTREIHFVLVSSHQTNHLKTEYCIG